MTEHGPPLVAGFPRGHDRAWPSVAASALVCGHEGPWPTVGFFWRDALRRVRVRLRLSRIEGLCLWGFRPVVACDRLLGLATQAAPEEAGCACNDAGQNSHASGSCGTPGLAAAGTVRAGNEKTERARPVEKKPPACRINPLDMSFENAIHFARSPITGRECGLKQSSRAGTGLVRDRILLCKFILAKEYPTSSHGCKLHFSWSIFLGTNVASLLRMIRAQIHPTHTAILMNKYFS